MRKLPQRFNQYMWILPWSSCEDLREVKKGTRNKAVTCAWSRAWESMRPKNRGLEGGRI